MNQDKTLDPFIEAVFGVMMFFFGVGCAYSLAADEWFGALGFGALGSFAAFTFVAAGIRNRRKANT